MSQGPSAVGLFVCRDFIVEEDQRSVTLVRCLDRVRLKEFPSTPQSFIVYSVLTDGVGSLPFDLIVTRLETLEEIYSRSWISTLNDPLAKTHLRLRVRSCSFPYPGRYEVARDVKGDRVAQCVLTVHSEEGQR